MGGGAIRPVGDPRDGGAFSGGGAPALPFGEDGGVGTVPSSGPGEDDEEDEEGDWVPAVGDFRAGGGASVGGAFRAGGCCNLSPPLAVPLWPRRAVPLSPAVLDLAASGLGGGL